MCLLRWLPVESLAALPPYDFLVKVPVTAGNAIGLVCSLLALYLPKEYMNVQTLNSRFAPSSEAQADQST